MVGSRVTDSATGTYVGAALRDSRQAERPFRESKQACARFVSFCNNAITILVGAVLTAWCSAAHPEG
jgi:hypothetical protein